MNKEPGFGFHPGRNLAQKEFVVPHVLEHLDGEYAVEAQVRREVVHVGGNDHYVAKAPLPAALQDEFALRPGIGDCGDACLRVVLRHPKRE